MAFEIHIKILKKVIDLEIIECKHATFSRGPST